MTTEGMVPAYDRVLSCSWLPRVGAGRVSASSRPTYWSSVAMTTAHLSGTSVFPLLRALRLHSHVQTVLALKEVVFWGQPAPNRAGSTRGAAGGSAGFPGGHV